MAIPPERRRAIKDVAWENAAGIIADIYGGGHFLENNDGFEDATMDEEEIFSRELQRVANVIRAHQRRLARRRDEQSNR